MAGLFLLHMSKDLVKLHSNKLYYLMRETGINGGTGSLKCAVKEEQQMIRYGQSPGWHW